MKNSESLGGGKEFDRIRQIWNTLGDRAEAGGDDCAIVELGLELMAISTDSSVEGTHFQKGWLSFQEIGWRATAAALSDLAAVAADPRGVLVSLGVPEGTPDEFVVDLMDGAGEATNHVGAKIWGGDLFRSERIVVDVTVVGTFSGPPVRRSGASPGDTLWVTGALGGAADAVASLMGGQEPEESCRRAFAKPEPRSKQSFWLRDRGATSMIDVSDGVVSDLGHLLAASGVSGTLKVDSVPRAPGATAVECELTGGEDYELLFTMPGRIDISEEFQYEFGLAATRVGHVEAGEGITILRYGQPYVPINGFRHF